MCTSTYMRIITDYAIKAIRKFVMKIHTCAYMYTRVYIHGKQTNLCYA